MASVADIGIPTARASTVDAEVYPTPAKEHGVDGAGDTDRREDGDKAAPKLLFPNTSKTKRVGNNGGLKDLPISDSNEPGLQIPTDQIIESSSLECPSAPLKKCKTGFRYESDEEAEMPEVLGEVSKLYDARTFRAALKDNRPANKGKRSPADGDEDQLPKSYNIAALKEAPKVVRAKVSAAQRKAKNRFLVSKPSPRPSPGPIDDNDPEPISTTSVVGLRTPTNPSSYSHPPPSHLP